MAPIERLLSIMARLRDPEAGCPWDLEQDFASIAPYTIEEAYEVDDAIRRGDFEGLRHELGDLLLQVVYHAQMAREQERFDFAAVVDSICEKLVRRHPHVFGEARIADAAAQIQAWEEHKAAERSAGGRSGALDGIPLGLPALLRAGKLQRRAAQAGFAWRSPEDALAKLAEERGELADEVRAGAHRDRIARELGDFLFAAAALAVELDLEPEEVLRAANARFEERFRSVEETIRGGGRSPSDLEPAEWLSLWERAKRAGKDAD